MYHDIFPTGLRDFCNNFLSHFIGLYDWRKEIAEKKYSFVHNCKGGGGGGGDKIVEILLKSCFLMFDNYSRHPYLESPLSRTFSLVSSALSLTAFIKSFHISNPAMSNFHYVKLFSRSLLCILGLFSIRYFERWKNILENFNLMFIFSSYFNTTTCRK